MDLAGSFLLEEVDDGGQGVAFVEDVVEHQHRAVAQVLGRADPPVQQRALQGVAVAGGMQVGQLKREGQAWQQAAGEDQAAVHHHVDQRVLVLQAHRDVGGQLVERRVHLGRGA